MFFGNNKRANLSFPCFVLMVASLLLLSPYQLRCTLVMPTGKARQDKSTRRRLTVCERHFPLC